MEGNEPWNYHSKIKSSASFFAWDGKTTPGNQECNHAGQENSTPLVLIVSELSLKIAISE